MDDLDLRLSRAADSLRSAVDGIDVPDLVDGRPGNGSAHRDGRSVVPLAVAAAMVTLLTVGAFVVARRPADDVVVTEPAPTSPLTTDGQPAPASSSEPVDTASDASIPAGSIPKPTLDGLVSDLEPRAVTPIEAAAPGEAFAEPDFETMITRVTASGAGEVIAPASSMSQVYNADGTLLLLYRTGVESPGHVVVDAATGEIIATPDLSAATDIEDVSWDAVDPSVFRYVDSGASAVVEVDATSGEQNVTHTFDGCDRVDFGDASGSVAGRSAVMAVVCRTGDGAEWIAYDTVGGAEQAREPAIETARGSFDAPLTMASGGGFVLVDDESIVVLDDGLRPTGLVVDVRVSAATLALDGEGNDVLIATVFDDPDGEAIGTAVEVDLTTGAQRVITGEATGYPYPPTGTTIGVAGGADSTLVAIITSPGVADPELLDDEVLLVDLVTETTYRLAHHRMIDADDFGNWSTPYVAVAPDGSSVLFSSNFDGGAVDTFSISLTE